MCGRVSGPGVLAKKWGCDGNSVKSLSGRVGATLSSQSSIAMADLGYDISLARAVVTVRLTLHLGRYTTYDILVIDTVLDCGTMNGEVRKNNNNNNQNPKEQQERAADEEPTKAKECMVGDSKASSTQ
jgi:hypothetical protein